MIVWVARATCEGAPPRARKGVGAAAHDALDHAEEVRVQPLEGALLQVVAQEANLRGACAESVSFRLFVFLTGRISRTALLSL